MSWEQTGAVLGLIIAVLAIFSGFLMWVASRIDADVKSIGSKVDSIAKRLDGHASRIDQLYQMFIDLLKENKK